MRFAAALSLCLSIAALGQPLRLGDKAADFTVADLQGGKVAISPAKGDVTVVMFISAICPVSNNYNVRINDLYRDYSAKGVKFVFINANQNEKPALVQDHARRAGFPFAVYADVDNVVADRLGAQSTPETFVIAGNGAIRYHGRIDDSQNPARVQHHSLRLAIDAVLAGREVAAPETKAFGCTIKRVRKTS
jgi:peroxiredoxin